MKNERHLTRPEDFTLIYSKGRAWSDKYLVMKVLNNRLDITRYGFSISRRVGKATVRNYIKRILREIMRQTPLKCGWDILIIARVPAADVDFTTMKTSVEGLLNRARLLAEDYEGVCPRAN